MIEIISEAEAESMIKADPTLRIVDGYLVTLDGRKVAMVVNESKPRAKRMADAPLKEGKRRKRNDWERTEWIWGR